MKSLAVVLVLGAAILGAQGQYKAPSQYFRKDFPAPTQGGQPAQQQPQARPQPAPQQPQVPVRPKFKDVATNGQFYFLTDTNRAYTWVKVSATVATNMKTGIKQTLHPEIPVQH